MRVASSMALPLALLTAANPLSMSLSRHAFLRAVWLQLQSRTRRDHTYDARKAQCILHCTYGLTIQILVLMLWGVQI